MVRPLARVPRARVPQQNGVLVTDVDEQEVLNALAGLSFPADRYTVTCYVTDRGGFDPRILGALNQLPDRVFSNAEDVVISLPDRL